MPAVSRDGDGTCGTGCTWRRWPEPGCSQPRGPEADALEWRDGDTWGCNPEFACPGRVVMHCQALYNVPSQVPTILGPHGHRSDAAVIRGEWYPSTGSLCSKSAAPAPIPAHCSYCRLWRGAAWAPAPKSMRWWDLSWQQCQLQAWASSASSTGPGTPEAEEPVISTTKPQPSCPSSLLIQLFGPLLPSCRTHNSTKPRGKGFLCLPMQL